MYRTIFKNTSLSGSGMLETSRFQNKCWPYLREQICTRKLHRQADHLDLGDNKEGQDSPEGDETSNVAFDSESLDQNQSHGGMPLSSQAVEDMFLKVKALSDKRIAYEHFLDLLCNLSLMRFYGFSPSLLPNGSSMRPLMKEVALVMNMPGTGPDGGLDDEELANQFGRLVEDEIASSIDQCHMAMTAVNVRYGRLVGRPALICKFIFRYLSHCAEYKKSVAQLGKRVPSLRASQKLCWQLESYKHGHAIVWPLRLFIGAGRISEIGSSQGGIIGQL